MSGPLATKLILLSLILKQAKVESLKPQVSEDGLYVRLENDLLKT
jgi:hypothetical protein